MVHVVQNDPSSTDASQVPSSTLPSADFVSADINFNTGNSDATSTANFLNNATFVNQTNGFNPAASADNLFLEVTGQTFLAAGSNSFVVGHDDGVVLVFSDPSIGLVVNQAGPTSFVNTPFNVNAPSSGFYGFDLKYAECCGGPADLVFSINGQPVGAPEPNEAALFITGFSAIGLIIAIHRRSAD